MDLASPEKIEEIKGVDTQLSSGASFYETTYGISP